MYQCLYFLNTFRNDIFYFLEIWLTVQTTGLILKEYTSKFFLKDSHTSKYSSNIWKLFPGNTQQFRKRFEALAFVEDNSGELLQIPCDKETPDHTPHSQMKKDYTGDWIDPMRTAPEATSF